MQDDNMISERAANLFLAGSLSLMVIVGWLVLPVIFN